MNVHTLKAGGQLTEEVGTPVHGGKDAELGVQRRGPVLGTQLLHLCLQSPLLVTLVNKRGRGPE